ncbi:type III-A CRISPR-associated protein Csm2 [Mangrovibacterium sp.]|uniref:type III-A CRISPR-associated protein Csm2 n=1 Tax=Mangrovibacterium sp. TaxID=1961364 RepID=UPI0035640C6D
MTFKQHGNYSTNNGQRERQSFTEPFKPEWIKKGISQETVKFADSLGKYVKDNGLTASQIRNVFGEIKRIQMKGFDKETSSFYLLRPKMAYAASRHNKAGINTLKRYFDEAHEAVTDKLSYQNFVDFFESILAYHKAYGGKD